MKVDAGNKVYIEIVRKLRAMIDEDGLKAGDKIPSERELSERLHVGRSSVREALRALELLGLIETRRGEGTFLRDSRGNQLVQLLSTFILQDEKAIRDVETTKQLIEMDGLRLIIERNNSEQLRLFKEKFSQTSLTDDDFFQELLELADNFLVYRIWTILKDFYYSLDFEPIKIKKAEYIQLLDSLIAADEEAAMGIYKKIRELSSE